MSHIISKIQFDDFIAYIENSNKWCIIFKRLSDNKKVHYSAIAPTNGNRIDIFGQKLNSCYIYDFTGIIVKITNGIPKLINLNSK